MQDIKLQFVMDAVKVTLMLTLVYSWLFPVLFLLQGMFDGLFWCEKHADRYIRFNDSWRRLFGRDRK